MSARYDRAVTIFSPDGHLLQVEYAQEAVRRGSSAVGVRGKSSVVLGVEKKSIPTLQKEQTVRKICMLDDHVVLAFAGLTADARVLTNYARLECQKYKLNFEDEVTLEYITRYIAQLKQKYTQSSGRRPFGLACLIGGFDNNGVPHLYQTEPTGNYHEWKANAVGRAAKTAREYLEKHYKETDVDTTEKAVKLTIKTLLEVAQSGQKNLEIAVMEKGTFKTLPADEIAKYVATIEEEQKSEAEKKK